MLIILSVYYTEVEFFFKSYMIPASNPELIIYIEDQFSNNYVE